MVSIVGAVPPLTSVFSGDTGLEIQAPILPTFPIGESGEFVLHVFNRTNGVLFNGTTVQCRAVLAGINGSELYQQDATPHSDHFDLFLNGTHITESGLYGFTINCNNSVAGGFLTGYFEATTSGINHEEPEAIINGIYLMMLFGISIFFLIFSRNTEHPGIKLFFNLLDYISMLTAVGAGYIILQGFQTNLTSLAKVIMISMGLIFIVIMYYVFINLTRQSLALMRAKKGFGSDLDNPTIF